MFPSTLNMGPVAAFAILCILGAILYKNVQGSTCINPLENLHTKRTLDIQNLLEIFNVSHRTYFEANDLSEQNQHGIDKSRIKTLCFLTICFDVNCSCKNAKKNACTSTDRNNTLTRSDLSLSCMIFNRRINEANNELEKRNTTQTEDVQDDNVSFANEAFTQKRDYRFPPLPLAVAFTLGTIFGCMINVFTILICRKRQSKKRIDSLEDIQMYSKFVGETSAYSEISESNQIGQLTDTGAYIGEYMEPISTNTILQKALKPLADQDENRETNAYFTLTLDKRQADSDGYNHLKPNTGRILNSPIQKENDSLYHKMASAESEITQVDNEHAENPVILEEDTDDGYNTQISDVKPKGVQGESLQDERPYSMCMHVRDVTEDGDNGNEMQERNENTNTEDAYFVLEKQIA